MHAELKKFVGRKVTTEQVFATHAELGYRQICLEEHLLCHEVLYFSHQIKGGDC